MNEMRANNDKCHLITTNNTKTTVKLGNETIASSSSVNLLRVFIDNKITISEHN